VGFRFIERGKDMAKGYVVSKDGTSRYSGMPDQRLYSTKAGAEARVKKVKKLTGKKYKIREAI
jgi:hypothetical protein